MAKKKTKVEEPIVEKTEEIKDDNVTKVEIKSEPIDDDVIRVDLRKPPVQQSEEVEQQPAEEDTVVVVNPEPEAKVEEEVKEEVVEEETPIVQEITDEEVQQVEEEVEEAIQEAEATGKPLPENIQKLVDFMDETGGDINDYVNLNRDVSKMDDSDVLDEYYRTTKSHLTAEERSFLLEDNFGYDEEADDPNYIRKKKIALKEQVAEARAHLDGQKSKYYEDIKAGSKLTSEQQKAIDFFNRYNKESEEKQKASEASKKTFLKKTNSIFDKNFKGFDYEVGDKKFRFNVKDVDKVKTTQSDLNNFINRFTDKDGSVIEDARGYHKSLFTAMNADAIAKHFYEQGKADAIKSQVAKDKNINLNPRQTHGETNVGGVKYRVLGSSTDDLKLRIKNRKSNNN